MNTENSPSGITTTHSRIYEFLVKKLIPLKDLSYEDTCTLIKVFVDDVWVSSVSNFDEINDYSYDIVELCEISITINIDFNTRLNEVRIYTYN